MAQCQICHVAGSNMKRCKKCGQIWCTHCAHTGKGGRYPKQTADNKCPYCGALDKIETFK